MLELRPVSHHTQTPARPRERAYGHIHALVGHQFGDHQVVIFRLAPIETLHSHRRVHHPRIPPPGLLNAAADMVAVGDELIHARGGGNVPKPQIVADGREQSALPRREPLPGISGIQVPDVTHGRVAVTDVPCGRRRQNTLGGARFAADHQIVAAQIELLERHRQERQQMAVVPPQRIEERRSDVVAPDFGADRARIVKQREDIGIRQKPAEGLQHLLAASPVQQPIMYDRGPHPHSA